MAVGFIQGGSYYIAAWTRKSPGLSGRIFGGESVSINSKEENSFIRNKFKFGASSEWHILSNPSTGVLSLHYGKTSSLYYLGAKDIGRVSQWNGKGWIQPSTWTPE